MSGAEQRNLIHDRLFLRTKWNTDSEYPIKIQAMWLEAVERAIAAEENEEKLEKQLRNKNAVVAMSVELIEEREKAIRDILECCNEDGTPIDGLRFIESIQNARKMLP